MASITLSRTARGMRVRTVQAWWRAKRALGLSSVADAETGTITFVQSFDSGLRASPTTTATGCPTACRQTSRHDLLHLTAEKAGDELRDRLALRQRLVEARPERVLVERRVEAAQHVRREALG